VPEKKPTTASVIVPCYNEAHSIRGLLLALLAQTYPLEEMEVVIADGGSDDGTREHVEQFSKDHPELSLRIIENPAREIPVALNLAIRHSQGQVVVRLDAHSVPDREYVRRCLETSNRTGAANVGGVWDIRPGNDTWVARAIARAAAHPVGAGDARYRVRGAEGAVDTVPFGAFRRQWLGKVGRFNEDLLANEDYEYNARIRRLGGTVWFNPEIRSSYIARPSLRALGRQYARYGFWKARMLLRYPNTLRWRQALPPLFVLSTPLLAALSLAWPTAGGLLAIEWGAYVILQLVAAVAQALRHRDITLTAGMPLAWITMHLAWGSAFWWGLLTGLFRRKPASD
jgi:glycosyltransferase involved in cell wall biosynthesis